MTVPIPRASWEACRGFPESTYRKTLFPVQRVPIAALEACESAAADDAVVLRAEKMGRCEP